ncbi:preprotein translocase subunit SecY [Vibrio sp. D431a]|uniref:preprotein translocase subunit SecY n=1 Tax=Vibrio sp. D431a TaxID=2837388 RepID=UPI002553CC76|nr:preprotein translocase subunit SecY [Vibrio sp. D431a]MDK9790605.1 preprotein translocase subunit SecY [Vibrio sp. D431a]
MRFIRSNTLLKSIFMLCGFLLLYRVGSHTPIPFVNKEVFSEIFNNNANGLLGMYNIMNGGALSRMSVFTLGIMPYISASIVMFMFQLFHPDVKEMAKREDGRLKLEMMKRYLTVAIVFMQGITIATVLQSQSVNGQPVATINGFAFYVTTILSLMAGTFSVVWIANVMTFIGFGSGTSLVIVFGILSSMPQNIITIATMAENGSLNMLSILSLIAFVLFSFVVVILFENTERRIPVQKPDRLVGSRKSYLTIKANPVGIMPPIFAAICLSMPVSMIQMLGNNAPDFLIWVRNFVSHGSIGYAIFYATLVFVFGLGMARVVHNPDKMSEGLMRQGAIIPTMRPGKDTERYLKKVIYSLSLIACVYLVVLCSIPEFINYYMTIPLYLGGTSILILVSASSDMKKNIYGMLETNAYKDLENKLLS